MFQCSFPGFAFCAPAKALQRVVFLLIDGVVMIAGIRVIQTEDRNRVVFVAGRPGQTFCIPAGPIEDNWLPADSACRNVRRNSGYTDAKTGSGTREFCAIQTRRSRSIRGPPERSRYT